MKLENNQNSKMLYLVKNYQKKNRNIKQKLRN